MDTKDNELLELRHLIRRGDGDRVLLTAQVQTLQVELAALQAAKRERLVLDQWIENRTRELESKLEALVEAMNVFKGDLNG